MTVIAPPDPMAVIRLAMLGESSITDLLLPQAALPGLTEDAPIFAYEYPRKESGKPTTAYTGHDWAALLQARSIRMVLLMPSGRRPSTGDNSRAPIQAPRFDVWSFGRTKGDATIVHWAVYAYLKNLSRVRAVLSTGTALLHDVVIEGGPITFNDQDTDAPVVLGTYSADVAEEYVA